MRFSIYIVLFMACFLLPWNTSAQNLLEGKVTDGHTGKPLAAVIIEVPDIKTAVLTDSAGNFQISPIPQGTYLVEAHRLGYAAQILHLTLKGRVTKDIAMVPSPLQLREVVVTGVMSPTDNLHNPVPVTVVSHDYLLEHSATNVIDAVTEVPGVSGITDGQSITKPVIRGLGYNRVLTINDGVEQMDQPWFDEFGIEADPYAVYRYEILKGPASLAYGSDAIAGVLNLLPEAPLPEGSEKAELLYHYQTNNGLMAAMAHLAGTRRGISWSARVDQTMAHAYRNPQDGYVLNSQFSNFNAGGTLGLHRKWGYSQIHASYFEMHTGIVDGTRDSTTGLMERPVAYPDLNGGVPTYELPTHQEQVSYTPFVINQRIRHTKWVWDNSYAIGEGKLKGVFSWQKNQRQEYNDPTSPNTPIIYYSSNALTFDLHYLLPEKHQFRLSFGTNGAYQSSRSLGLLLLIPDYRFFEAGLFAIGNKKWGKLTLSGGVRADTRAFQGLDHWVDSTTQEPTSPQAPNAFHEFRGFTSNFSGWSYSAGAAYDFTSSLYAKFNIAAGWRAPNVAECGANGVHDGTVVYEIGDPRLVPETSMEEDLTLGTHSKNAEVELTAFYNRITHFIYSRGLSSVLGGDSINNSLNAVGLGEAPVYKYTQGTAQLYGGEFSLALHPRAIRWVALKGSFSLVGGGLRGVPDSVKYLPFMPPAKTIIDLRFPIAPSRALQDGYLSIGISQFSEQKKVYQQYAIYNGLNTALTPYEYAASRAATKGYTLLHAGLGGAIMSKGTVFCKIYLICENLLNTTYMDYMSRFKYYPVNYSTGRVGVFNMGRNLSVKVLFPLSMGKHPDS